jgi:hypothetical protein
LKAERHDEFSDFAGGFVDVAPPLFQKSLGLLERQPSYCAPDKPVGDPRSPSPYVIGNNSRHPRTQNCE